MSLDNFEFTTHHTLSQQVFNFLFNLSNSLWRGNNSWPLVAHTHTHTSVSVSTVSIHGYIYCVKIAQADQNLVEGSQCGDCFIVVTASAEGSWIYSWESVWMVWMGAFQATLEGSQMIIWIQSQSGLCVSSNCARNVHLALASL
jgi:hypothetical protein